MANRKSISAISFFTVVAMIGALCNWEIPATIPKSATTTPADTGMDVWFLSGFFNDHNAHQYSTACLLYTLRKPKLKGVEGLISTNISLSCIEQKDYLYRRINIPYHAGMMFTDAENMGIKTGMDAKELMVIVNNKNCFLKTELIDYFMKMSGKPSIPLSEILYQDTARNVEGSQRFFFSKDADIRVDHGDERIKGNGLLFLNYFGNQESLLKYYSGICLLNIWIDSTEEYYNILFSNAGTSADDSITVLSAYGTHKQIHPEGIAIKPLQYWNGPVTGKRYGIKWQVDLSNSTVFIISSTLENQEVVWMKTGFWMGSFWVTAVNDSTNKIGRGTSVIF